MRSFFMIGIGNVKQDDNNNKGMEDFTIKNGILTAYKGSGPDLIIPEGVEAIDNYAFADNTDICSVVLPNSLRLIGCAAFIGCKALENVKFGSGKLVVQQYAFAGCKALESVYIPGNVQTINYCMFKGCSSLREVRLGDGVKNISVAAFKRCVSLEEIHLPSSIYQIRRYAFSKCTGLRKVVFEVKPYIINNRAFHKCHTSLEFKCLSGRFKVEMENGFLMTTLARTTNWVKSYFGTSRNVVIPESADVIGEGSFSHRDTPFSVTVPGHLVNIGYGAFFFSGVEKIKIESTKQISKIAFWGCSNLEEIVLPKKLERVGDDAFGSCSNLKKLVFNNERTTFEGRITPMCYRLEEVVLPSHLKEIPPMAFYYNKSLKRITIPNTVEQIGSHAFVGCKSLRSVSIPPSVKLIDLDVFHSCECLKEVILESRSTEHTGRFDGFCTAAVRYKDEAPIKTMIIMIGVRLSGRSEYYRRYLAEKYVHIDERNEAIISTCISDEREYVIDEDNLTAEVRRAHIARAKSNGYRVIGYYLFSDIESCIVRNNYEPDSLKMSDEEIVKQIHSIDIPKKNEGFDELYYVDRTSAFSSAMAPIRVEEWEERQRTRVTYYTKK